MQDSSNFETSLSPALVSRRRIVHAEDEPGTNGVTESAVPRSSTSITPDMSDS